MKKKGVITVTHTIVGLIITLVAFFLLSATFGRLFVKADAREAQILCRDTVLARVSSTIQAEILGDSKVKVNIAPLLCQTIDTEITSTDPQEAMREMAELMVQCKHMFADGLYANVFNAVVSEQHACFPCFTVVTPNFGRHISKQEFQTFLSTKTNDKKKELTYMGRLTFNEYLTNYRSVPGRVILTVDDVTAIESDHTYTIYYHDPDLSNIRDSVTGRSDPEYNSVILAPTNSIPVLGAWEVFGQEIAAATCSVQSGSEQQ